MLCWCLLLFVWLWFVLVVWLLVWTSLRRTSLHRTAQNVALFFPAGVSDDSPRTPNVHILGPGASKSPPRFNEKTPKRGQKERKMWREREQKARNFGPPTLRGPTLRSPTLRCPIFLGSPPPPLPSGPHLQGLPKCPLPPLPPPRIVIIIIIVIIIFHYNFNYGIIF